MNYSSMITSTRVFGWLLWCDLRFISRDFWNNLLDSLSWPFAIIFINSYVSPALGLPSDYGSFMTVSMLIIMCSFGTWVGSNNLSADLAGPQAISFELTLPLPYYLVWIKHALYLAIKSMLFNFVTLIIGKLILLDGFDLSNFSALKFVIIYCISNVFFGVFAIWGSVVTKNVDGHSRLETRLAGPLFYMSGFTSSWMIMHKISFILGVITLCTPWIYAYEGTRAAIFGQNDYLHYWVCVGALVSFTIVFAFHGITKFKARLDCV